MQLELRVFIRGMENWLIVLNDINSAIDREFKRAEIPLSTTTSDTYIRSIDDELVIRQPLPMEGGEPTVEKGKSVR